MVDPINPTAKPEDDNIESKVGKRGFQDGLFDQFTKLTQSGKELLEKIAEFAAEKEKEEKDIFLQILEFQIKAVQVLLSMLKGEESEQKNKQQMNEQAAAETSQKLAKNAEEAAKPPEIDPKDAEKNELEDSLKSMNDELLDTEMKYKSYDENLDKAEKTIDELPQDRDAKIAKLQKSIDDLVNDPSKDVGKMMDLVASDDPKKKAEGQKMLKEEQARAVQVGALQDMLDVTEGKKKMYDQDGVQTDSFKKGKFVIPADKKLEKHGGDFYLLGKDDDFSKLSDKGKEKAKNDFTKDEKKFLSMRETINSNKTSELGSFGKKIDSVKDKIETLNKEPEKTQSESSSPPSKDKDSAPAKDSAPSTSSKGSDSDSSSLSSLADTSSVGSAMMMVIKVTVKVLSEVAKAIEQANAASQKATLSQDQSNDSSYSSGNRPK